MKKYSWLAMLVFVLAIITCVIIISKNEAVRDVFMKSANDINYYAVKIAKDAENLI